MAFSIKYDKQQEQVFIAIPTVESFTANFNIALTDFTSSITKLSEEKTVDDEETQHDNGYDNGYDDGYDFAFRLATQIPFTMVYPDEPYNNGFIDGYNAAWTEHSTN
jgi:hypothetical protein